MVYHRTLSHPAQHALSLHTAGLVALPAWGGGKSPKGRDHRWLADNPPTRDAIVSADYSGGLVILCGTSHPQGGYVLGVDIDHGPDIFPWRPHGFLLLEAGTGPGKWHLFLRALDRLDGIVNLRDQGNALVCEVKGRGHALRSYPTIPPDKPRGYTVVELVNDPVSSPPKVTARQAVEDMADLLTRLLECVVRVERAAASRGKVALASPSLAQAVEAELERRGVILRPAGRDGWHLGRCPFHEDRNPSFSVSFTLGAWHCFAGCGSGGLRALAQRLGLQVARWRHGRPILPTVEVGP